MAFEAWYVRIFRASIAYAFVQLLVRIAGRKELSRYANHDIVLLFLISTAMRQSIVGSDTSVTTALVGVSTLFALDWTLSCVSFRNARAAELVEGRVYELVKHGELIAESLRRSRISRDELLAAIRCQGRVSIREVGHAYLERSGQKSLVFSDRASSERGAQ